MTPTLSTELFPRISESVGPEGGGSAEGVPAVLGFSELEVPLEWNEHCYACNRRCRFVALKTFGDRFLAECSGCGEERVVRFTRMVG